MNEQQSTLNALLEISERLQRIEAKLDRPTHDIRVKWLRQEEALEALQVCHNTLRMYRLNGKLGASKISQKLYYKVEDINALLEANYMRKSSKA